MTAGTECVSAAAEKPTTNWPRDIVRKPVPELCCCDRKRSTADDWQFERRNLQTVRSGRAECSSTRHVGDMHQRNDKINKQTDRQTNKRTNEPIVFWAVYKYRYALSHSWSHTSYIHSGDNGPCIVVFWHEPLGHKPPRSWICHAWSWRTILLLLFLKPSVDMIPRVFFENYREYKNLSTNN